jgi:hypothetical protein
MGGKYSKVQQEYFRELRMLEGLSIIEIRSKMIGISKTFNKTGVYLLTKDDITFALDIPPVQMYQIIMMFDHGQSGSISSLDFWGALALLSCNGNEEKVGIHHITI